MYLWLARPAYGHSSDGCGVQAPSVNITCRITPDSPLWGKTYWDLENEGAGLYVAIAATDNQHFQEVFVRKFYVVAVRSWPATHVCRARSCFSIDELVHRVLVHHAVANARPSEGPTHSCYSILVTVLYR